MRSGALYMAGLISVAVAGGVALGLVLKRRRKSAAEKERERRLRVNAIGRICDGTIVELADSRDSAGKLVRHLHYHYSVAGATYSAAQDISLLRGLAPTDKCSEGVPASVKYDQQNPSNSIVICELWSGLR